MPTKTNTNTTTDGTDAADGTEGAEHNAGAENLNQDGAAAGTDLTAGEEALGDAGKQALNRMKAERNTARAEARDAQAQLAAARAENEGRKAEHDAELAAQKMKDEALAAANRRIALAELRAAAKGRLADPSDAATFINIDDIEVSETSEVDSAAVEALIEGLVQQKPYLAVAQGQRFQGSGDGGARNGQKPAQLTREDVRRLAAEGKHEEIVKAEAEGRLTDLMKAN